jgi:type IV secretion system protein VirD4
VFAAVAAVLVFYYQGSLGVGVLTFVILMILYFISMYMEAPETPPPEPESAWTTGKFGKAQFQETMGWFRAEDEDRLSRGVFFGMAHHPTMGGSGIPIASEPETHVLIVAKTGAGKTTRILAPTLLRAHKTSMIVLDPKGELAAITARARALHSHVHIMNPWGELGDAYERMGFPAATFNPLDLLDRDDPNVVSVAEAMGAAMCPKEESAREPYWAQEAARLIAATLLWLADDPSQEKTLGNLSDILTLDRDTFTKQILKGTLADWEGPDTYGGAVQRWSRPFIGMPDNQYGGVHGHMTDGVGFLADPQIRRATAKSSFRMEDLTGAGKSSPTTLYLVIPPKKIALQKVWLRLMITACTEVFDRKLPGAHYRCNIVIDEFNNIGKIQDFQTRMATERSSGIDYTIVVQSVGRVKEVYGDAHSDIIGNCTYQWFCNLSNDLATAEYLSKALGKKTIRVTNEGENTGTSTGGQHTTTSEGKSKSFSEVGVELMAPDEIMRLGRDTAILMPPRFYPHYLRPVDYWQLQDAFQEYPAAYPELYFDRNPCLSPTVAQCSPQPSPYRPGEPPAPYRSPDARAWEQARNAHGGAAPAQRPPIDFTAYAPKPGQSLAKPETQPQKAPQRAPIDFTLYGPPELHRPPKPAPEPAGEPTRSGSPNYDPSYYSDENIEKRKREQDKGQR